MKRCKFYQDTKDSCNNPYMNSSGYLDADQFTPNRFDKEGKPYYKPDCKHCRTKQSKKKYDSIKHLREPTARGHAIKGTRK